MLFRLDQNSNQVLNTTENSILLNVQQKVLQKSYVIMEHIGKKIYELCSTVGNYRGWTKLWKRQVKE